jgi:hypothetical protein
VKFVSRHHLVYFYMCYMLYIQHTFSAFHCSHFLSHVWSCCACALMHLKCAAYVTENITFRHCSLVNITFFFLFAYWGVQSKLGPLGTLATYWPIVPAPGYCEDGEFGGMNGRGNRSTRRKPALTPLCPPQIPLDQTRTAAVGSQRLFASAMARPNITFALNSFLLL